MNILKRHLFIFAIIGVYFTLSSFFDISCPIMYLIKIPCPTCGITKAIMALVQFDIKGYVEYNVMAFFMVTTVILLIHRNIFNKKRWVDWFSIFVILINTFIYFIRIA